MSEQLIEQIAKAIFNSQYENKDNELVIFMRVDIYQKLKMAVSQQVGRMETLNYEFRYDDTIAGLPVFQTAPAYNARKGVINPPEFYIGIL